MFISVEIIQVILVLCTFLSVKWIAYVITEEWGLPKFLDYEPYKCFKCLSFWSLMSLFLCYGFLLGYWITMGVGAILTVLDTIAFIVHQKNNTVKINDK